MATSSSRVITSPSSRGGGSHLTVLHLSAGNLYGGVERIVATCAAERGSLPELQPRFATFFEGRLYGELEASGVACERLGEVRVSRPLSVVRARRQLGRLLTADRPNAVITHSPWSFG